MKIFFNNNETQDYQNKYGLKFIEEISQNGSQHIFENLLFPLALKFISDDHDERFS